MMALINSLQMAQVYNRENSQGTKRIIGVN